MGDLNQSQQEALDRARGFYVGHQGAYGAMHATASRRDALARGDYAL